MTGLRQSVAVGSAAVLCAMPLARVQAQSHWSVRAEAGQSALHSGSSDGGAAALRLAGHIRSGVVRFVVGAAWGGADGGFRTLDAALELAPLPRWRLTPVGAIGVGGIVESDWSGAFVHLTGGLEVRISPRLQLRGALQAGNHGENQLGPNLTTLGLALRLGRLPER
jgi:hypothetical protein